MEQNKYIRQSLIDAGIIKTIILDDDFSESEADTWKYLTQKLLQRVTVLEVVEYVLQIFQGCSDLQWKCLTPFFYYDEGLAKPTREKKYFKKAAEGSGITAKINSKISILQIAKEYGLKIFGNKALCPFHQDTSPSLVFNPSKNLFRCWSSKCGRRGNIIDFIYECESRGLKRNEK